MASHSCRSIAMCSICDCLSLPNQVLVNRASGQKTGPSNLSPAVWRYVSQRSDSRGGRRLHRHRTVREILCYLSSAEGDEVVTERRRGEQHKQSFLYFFSSCLSDWNTNDKHFRSGVAIPSYSSWTQKLSYSLHMYCAVIGPPQSLALLFLAQLKGRS